MAVPLLQARDETQFGGKAVQLGAAMRAGLPVPPGVVLAQELAERAASDAQPYAELLAQLGGLVAVRSSGIGEDGAVASFAGQHATILGVRDPDALAAAIAEVLQSSRTDAAIAYRRKLGLDPQPRMAVVVQKLVRADVAGVLFTKNPVDGSDERVIEASWGLGEAVVQGLVVPDHFRVARGGGVISITPGDKDVAIYWAEAGGTEERPVEPERAAQACLDPAQLAQLDALATRCESVFGGTQDLEFAFQGSELYLLQRRAITRG
jgi:pyruvate,water dikinase